MNLELSVLEINFSTEEPRTEGLYCEIQISTTQVLIAVPSTEVAQIPFSVDLLDDAVTLTLRDSDIIGFTRITLRSLVHEEEARWYPVKSQRRGKLILKTPIAMMRVQAKVMKRKATHKAHSSMPSPTSIKELRIPNRSPVSDNPNPSPPRPFTESPIPPRKASLELEQALNTVNEKVQTFERIDGEMGRIKHQLAGLISSINSLESFENESELIGSPQCSKIPMAVSGEVSNNRGDSSQVDDRLGKNFRKAIGCLKPCAESRGSPSILFTDFDDLRQEIKSLTDAQKSQEKDYEDLKVIHTEVLEAARAKAHQEKTAREALVSDKEAMMRMIAKLTKELKVSEESLRNANHELRLLKLQKVTESGDKTLKTQPAKLVITQPVPDFTHLFERQMEQHKELVEKYEKMFEECRKHRMLIANLQKEISTKNNEIEMLRANAERQKTEIDALKQTCHFFEEENQKLKDVGLASAARINELTELSRDVGILSNVSLIHSEKALAAHIVITKLAAKLKEKDEELKKFKNVALPKYYPDPEDQTDVALGSYLSQNLVQVPFIREEPGVYRFGTKRVFIRLEQGNIIIRVGGGYMHLDEFIDIYTPMELGKLSPRPEDAMKTALAQKLMEQLDEKFVPCIGLNKKEAMGSSDV